MSRAIAPKKRTAPRTTSQHRPRRDTRKGYVCGGCGFHEDLPEPDWYAEDFPVWRGTQKDVQKSWLPCPNDEGPDTGFLTKPDRSCQRIRDTFCFGPLNLRACSLFTRVNRHTSPRALVSETDIRLNVYRQWYRDHRGADSLPDVRRLAEATEGSLEIQVVKEGGLWLLPYHLSRVPNRWYRSILKLQKHNAHARRVNLSEVLRILEPRALPQIETTAVLHVPFDLRFPIEDQVKRLKPELIRFREHLHRFTDDRVRGSASPDLWRDIYVFLRAETTPRGASSISDEVFGPNEQGGAARVRKIHMRIRDRLSPHIDRVLDADPSLG